MALGKGRMMDIALKPAPGESDDGDDDGLEYAADDDSDEKSEDDDAASEDELHCADDLLDAIRDQDAQGIVDAIKALTK